MTEKIGKERELTLFGWIEIRGDEIVNIPSFSQAYKQLSLQNLISGRKEGESTSLPIYSLCKNTKQPLIIVFPV